MVNAQWRCGTYEALMHLFCDIGMMRITVIINFNRLACFALFKIESLQSTNETTVLVRAIENC